jgi:predicted ATPase
VSAVLPGDVVIRTPDQRLRVFVSSTLEELAAERRAVERAVTALRLTPVLFELGARPHPPRQLYRAYLAQSDVFVGLYWQRYGWIAPDMEISGLEDEFELAGGLPRLLYVKTPAPHRDPRLTDLLRRISDQDSYRQFTTPAQLGRLVRDDLAVLLSERFTTAPMDAVPVAAPRPRPLPSGPTTLVGRREAIAEVAALAADPEVRLVTLTGPGGVGKTRLALAAAERLRDRFAGRTAFVSLAGLSDPALVMPAVARALGADLAGTASPVQAVAERFSGDAWLLVLDNVEQVAAAARELDELLVRSPGVTIVATSRTALTLRAEREYPVPPLPLPGPASVSPAEIAESPAVALFVDRARAVRPGFTLTVANAPAVAAICRRLEGLPLAIELAAARIRLLDPATLEARLGRSMDLPGGGPVDMPARQQTLRATVAWSVDLLEDAERSLLEVCSVFVGGWTLRAAAEVAELDEDRALELTEALDRHSLIQSVSDDPDIRCRMLETVRVFVAERLAARPDAAEIRRRHADCYRRLAERAAQPLRRGAQDEWAMRLAAEVGNLAAAVHWYLAEDTASLPDLFVNLLPLWAVNDDFLDEARGWVERLLPTSDGLDAPARVKLLLADVVTAREVDDAAAAASRDRLGSLLEAVDEPYLHAVGELAVGTTSAVIDDPQRALHEEATALRELRGQDEPFWTSLALIALGVQEMADGRYDDAAAHLLEMRELAERFGNPRLIAAAYVNLGRLDIMRGRPGEAASWLTKGLDLSRTLCMTRNVSLTLTAVALLAFARGDPERAALLAGAAEGLRRRAGLRRWPMPPRERDLVAEVRQALGADRFDELFAAGTRLRQGEAVAAVRDHPELIAT